jgi:hypothetical protein
MSLKQMRAQFNFTALSEVLCGQRVSRAPYRFGQRPGERTEAPISRA